MFTFQFTRKQFVNSSLTNMLIERFSGMLQKKNGILSVVLGSEFLS